MPLNLEVKARCPSLKEASANAKLLGARDAGLFRQIDTYFSVASGRLKLREVGRKGELILYDRPNIKGNRYSRYSVVQVDHPKSVKSLFSRLYGRKVVVRKERRLFLMPNARIHLDRVSGLGSFIEFEVIVRLGRRSAESQMKFLWKAFGIRKNSVLSSSYSDMLMAKNQG